ncbi:DUF2280 domain-containing protein [Dongia sedimenti]|uniref:DUF2280 domain-containing protein n=1 Tax=Dongia sedimenti TaxID=3064282 RepID=A0ABU0YKM3_9PROT|nr:DUF2280 domain-containing protein [Rhodospirillaceae bacterium R-7]
MLAMQTAPMPISPSLGETAPRFFEDPMTNDAVKAQIIWGMRLQWPPERIAALVEANFHVAVSREQMLACWHARNTPPTQTGHRQDDKESVQFPADAEKAPLFTRTAPDEAQATKSETAMPYVISDAEAPETETPPPASVPDPELDVAGTDAEDAPSEEDAATQTEHRQDEEESLQIPADTVDEPTARDVSLQALADLAKARLGIAPDPAPATQTGGRQDRKTPIVLTDEVKTFIVKGLARYETPTRVAASVKTHFGIEIDRRQVFAYDPAGSRRPAKRWIALHAATRVKFNRALGEVGVAQKIVRLRMLDRFANRADEANQMERACRILEQAAKECGGFYERYARPKVAAV